MSTEDDLALEPVARTLHSISSPQIKRITLCLRTKAPSQAMVSEDKERSDPFKDSALIDRALSSPRFQHLKHVVSNAPFAHYLPFLVSRGVSRSRISLATWNTGGQNNSERGRDEWRRGHDTCWHCKKVSCILNCAVHKSDRYNSLEKLGHHPLTPS